jgi:hypothetical protein
MLQQKFNPESQTPERAVPQEAVPYVPSLTVKAK